MNNWILCGEKWVNFDHLDSIWVEETVPTKFYIQALNADGNEFDLFEASFKSYAEAQDFLDNFMDPGRYFS